MKNTAVIIWIFICLSCAGTAISAEVPISEATAECIDCHSSFQPGIVNDLQNSRHAMITPKEAIAVEGVARKASSTTVPESLQNVVVGCAECHGLRPKAHADTFEILSRPGIDFRPNGKSLSFKINSKKEVSGVWICSKIAMIRKVVLKMREAKYGL